MLKHKYAIIFIASLMLGIFFLMLQNKINFENNKIQRKAYRIDKFLGDKLYDEELVMFSE